PGFRGSRLTSVTSARRRLTTTYPPPPSSSALQPAASNARWESCHDAPRPAPRGVLHRAALQPTSSQRQYGERLSGHILSPPDVHREAAQEATLGASSHRSRRTADRGIPRGSREEPQQQRAHPQHSTRCYPLLLPLRCYVRARPRGSHSPCLGDPAEALQSERGHLPHPTGDRGTSRSTEPAFMDRPS